MSILQYLQNDIPAKNSPEFKIRKDVKPSMHFCVRFSGVLGVLLKKILLSRMYPLLPWYVVRHGGSTHGGEVEFFRLLRSRAASMKRLLVFSSLKSQFFSCLFDIFRYISKFFNCSGHPQPQVFPKSVL